MASSNRSRDPLLLQPGDLRQQITIESPSATPDSFGQSASPANWTALLTARAAIFTAGGRETSQASQLVSDVSHVVKIRYTPAVLKPGYRVILGSRYFTVQYVENVLERNRVLVLYCLEVNGGQA